MLLWNYMLTDLVFSSPFCEHIEINEQMIHPLSPRSLLSRKRRHKQVCSLNLRNGSHIHENFRVALWYWNDSRKMFKYINYWGTHVRFHVGILVFVDLNYYVLCGTMQSVFSVEASNYELDLSVLFIIKKKCVAERFLSIFWQWYFEKPQHCACCAQARKNNIGRWKYLMDNQIIIE